MDKFFSNSLLVLLYFSKNTFFIIKVLTRPWLVIYMFTLFKVLIFHVKTLLKCRTLAYLAHLTHVLYMCVLFIIM